MIDTLQISKNKLMELCSTHQEILFKLRVNQLMLSDKSVNGIESKIAKALNAINPTFIEISTANKSISYFRSLFSLKSTNLLVYFKY